jgi:ADP-ribose pyrophosphatase YjhB (NUDIX family)
MLNVEQSPKNELPITELAAGGVVIYSRDDTFDVLLIRNHENVWTYPKGLIEEHEKEDKLKAAEREVREETGVTSELTYLADIPVQTYDFFRNKRLTHKFIWYYIFEIASRDELTPQHNEGISYAKWFSIEEAMEIIGYKDNNLQILENLKMFLYNAHMPNADDHSVG